MNNLGNYRRWHNLSRKALSEKIGIPARTIEKWEMEDHALERASYISVVKLARFFGIKPEDLFGGDL